MMWDHQPYLRPAQRPGATVHDENIMRIGAGYDLQVRERTAACVVRLSATIIPHSWRWSVMVTMWDHQPYLRPAQRPGATEHDQENFMRIGTGYDLHRLEDGHPLILAGVTIPHDRGLAGHSDADALAHAVTDALLGAAALGDIGHHFPDTDPNYKDADSLVLLRRAHSLVHSAGYHIANIDATVVAQAPKLAPFIEAMRRGLADALEIEIHRVSVKAKTNENVGPEGRGEAISVQAVVLLMDAQHTTGSL